MRCLSAVLQGLRGSSAKPLARRAQTPSSSRSYRNSGPPPVHAAAQGAVHARQPPRRLLPHVELADLPQRVADHVLDEQPPAVLRGVDARAVVLGCAEPGAVEQIAIDVDLAHRLVEQLRLGRQRLLVQRGPAEVLHHQPQARAVARARRRAPRARSWSGRRMGGAPGSRSTPARPCGRSAPAPARPGPRWSCDRGLVDAAHVPLTRSSRRVSTRSESRCASASARAAPAWRS